MNEEQKIGQLLLREGVITQDQLEQALATQQESYNKALGEVLMELKFIDESDFLRILAKKFHTQYLTTSKLAEIKVPEAVLKLIPSATAEKYNVFPVQYKKNEKTLTVVMANPDNVSAVDEVKFVSGIGSVKALVGLADSIKAAIAKWYKNEQNAFEMLAQEDLPGYDLGGVSPKASHFEETDKELDLSALVTEPKAEAPIETDDDQIEIQDLGVSDDEEAVYLGGMDEMPGDNNLSREGILIEDLDEGDADELEEVEEVVVGPIQADPEVEAVEKVVAAASKDTGDRPSRRTDVKKYRLRMLVMDAHDSIRKFIVKLFAHEGFKVRGVGSKEEVIEELSRGEYDSLVIKDKDLGEGEEFAARIAEQFPGVELCSIKDYGSAVIGETRAQRRLMSSFLETLDVLMGLLEMESRGMQGHSHNTAKYARLIASKFDLPQRDVDTIALAAYVHELGKKGMPHRSVLRREEDLEPADLIEQAEIPLKLLSAAKIPLDIGVILRQQFEKWNGEGVPQGLKGEDINIGARIMALVEAFEDLTSKYSGTDPVEPSAALEIIKKEEGKAFDPELVNLFLGVVRDDIYLQQMSGAQDRIMIVDTESDLVTLLELRLVNMGFAVSTAMNGEQALELASSEKPAFIITEADLPDMTGFDMIEKAKTLPDMKDVHFLFISRKDDSNSVNKGFQLGAEDFIIKPIRVEILGAKVNTMMNRLKAEKKTAPAAAGVSGSLSEMGIPDIIQILGAGRKTGRISVQNGDESCQIDMEEGQVVNAFIDDLKGEEAFYKILYWEQGTFSIDPNATISERLITLSNDSLMLEGFRRMDEEGHGGGEDDITLDGSDFF